MEYQLTPDDLKVGNEYYIEYYYCELDEYVKYGFCDIYEQTNEYVLK